MKKVVRMLGLCALVALAFTSCKKNDNTNKVTFKATIVQPISDERTQLNSANMVIWLEGDEVQVFDESLNTEAFTVSSDYNEQTAATFTGDPTFLAKINEAGKYTAFYPVQTPVPGATTVTMKTVPASQTYVKNTEGRFADELFPMHATNNDEGIFEFTSDAGVLRIALNGPSDYLFKVKRIELIDLNESQVLTGTLTYDILNRTKTVTSNEGQVNKVVLECNNATLNDELVREFDIVVLDGAFANGFTLNVVRDDDEVFTRTTTKANLVEGGHIISMPSFDITHF